MSVYDRFRIKFLYWLAMWQRNNGICVLFCRQLLLLVLLVMPVAIVCGKTTPNVIVFLVDDMGYNGVGCYGSRFYKTPYIDALRNKGVKFDQSYAASSWCAPTRIGFLTGKNPARFSHHYNNKTPVESNFYQPPADYPDRFKLRRIRMDLSQYLREDDKTIADYLGPRYTTCHIGKWHLSTVKDNSSSAVGGFDLSIGGSHHGWITNFSRPPSGGWDKERFPRLENPNGGNTNWPTQRQLDQVYSQYLGDTQETPCRFEEMNHLTDALTYRALEFIQQQRHQEKPFFLYLSHYAVHTPMAPHQRWIDQYRTKTKEGFIARKDPTGVHGNPEYGSMTTGVDSSLGAICEMLQQTGLDDNTIIIFTSDNGGTSANPGVYKNPYENLNVADEQATSNYPHRSVKSELYEGGIRVPLIIAVPQSLRSPFLPGSTCDTPVTTCDFLPTILGWAKQTLPDNLDGIDLATCFKQDNVLQRKVPLIWHHPQYGRSEVPSSAIRMGKYKMIKYYEYEGATVPQHQNIGYDYTGTIALFDLEDDEAETKNIYLAYKDDAAVVKMKRALEAHLLMWKAKLPQINKTEYDATKHFPAVILR